MIKESLKFAAPLVLSRLITAAGIFGVAVITGHLSTEMLAAGALIMVILSLIQVGLSTLNGVAIQISGQLEASKQSSISASIGCNLMMSAVIATILFILLSNCHFFLVLANQPADVIRLSSQFYSHYRFAVIPLALIWSLQQILLGFKDSKIVLQCEIASAVTLLPLSYLLAFGINPFPRLELNGVSYAYIASYWIGFMVCYLRFRRRKLVVNWSLAPFKGLLKIGLPMALQRANEVGVLFIKTMIIGWFGHIALASQQISARYFVLTIIPLLAYREAVGILVAKYASLNNIKKIKSTIRVNLLIGISMSSIVICAYIFIPVTLTQFFMGNQAKTSPAIISTTILLLFIQAFNQFFDTFRNIISGSLYGIGSNNTPMLVNTAVIWLMGLPLGCLLAFHYHLSVIGINIGTTTGVGVAAVIMWFNLRKQLGAQYGETHYRLQTNG